MISSKIQCPAFLYSRIGNKDAKLPGRIQSSTVTNWDLKLNDLLVKIITTGLSINPEPN